MPLASVQSTAEMTPGRRYVLAIANASASTVTPQIKVGAAYYGINLEGGTTAFTVAAGATKWLELPAFGTILDVVTTDVLVHWELFPILP